MQGREGIVICRKQKERLWDTGTLTRYAYMSILFELDIGVDS